MEKVKAILLGAGARGNIYARYALEKPEEFEVVAVAEPDDERRRAFAETFHIPPENVFTDWTQLLGKPKMADAALICTMDQMHTAPALKALQMGYHVLLEKPMAPTEEECRAIAAAAEQSGKVLAVAHVLRYSPFYSAIKHCIDQGDLGRVVAIDQTENVGYWHQAHSFVRGNWRREDETSSMILQKSCHDMDILLWMAGSHCARVSSFGSLSHFKPENAPAGAPMYCLDGCPSADSCPYNAERIYLHDTGVHVPVIRKVVSLENTDESVRRALRSGPYGRCVYHCDNTVVDHQVVNLEFEDGITASFTMCGFTWEGSRTIKVMGTMGQISGDVEENKITVTLFAGGKQTVYHLDADPEGHSGGDKGFMEDVVRQVRSNGTYAGRSQISGSVEGHLIALAAEKSRLSRQTIEMNTFIG